MRGRLCKKKGRKKVAFIHILSSLFSCSISLLGLCFVFLVLLLLLPSTFINATVAFRSGRHNRRPVSERRRARARARDEREGGMKKRNSCLLTCASEKQGNKAAMSKAGVLFSPLFSTLAVFVKGAVVSSGYLYILFRGRERAGQSPMKCTGGG